jgi:hypothetical protein
MCYRYCVRAKYVLPLQLRKGVRGCLKSIFYKRELLKIDYLILLSRFV